jgi:two-component system, NarL family, response regulator LiaR
MTDGARQGVAIRVLIVDDHDLFRAGMASLLDSQPDIEMVAQASGGRMGVRLVGELQPDVVLMDLRMPDLEGPDATREILALRPQTRVLVFTVFSGDADVAAALGSGACGIVAKDTSPNDVAAAIRAAAQGVAWLSPRAAEVVLRRVRTQNMQRPSEPDPTELLSARQLDVLRLIARGKGNAEIAEALGISPRTAKNHVSNILSTLGLPGRVQAAVCAVRCGVI